eukprot:169814_1
MSRRDVIGEAGEQAPHEKVNLVELQESEHANNAQGLEEPIKEKQEETKPHSISTYLAIFQWILLIFCVVSNIYLLAKPSVECECGHAGSSAQNQNIISIIPTTNPPTNHPTDSPQTIPSYPSIISSSSDPTPKPTSNPSFAPTVAPTRRPSSVPSTGPTKQPTRIPSADPSSRPTAHPSVSPSDYPSASPTYFDGWFVGDYKYSFRSTSHSFWLLCDGQWLDITQYSLLYDVIGHTFGHYYNGTTHYFRVPDARDTVMGVVGSAHSMGKHIGNETHKLSQSETPEHIHHFVGGGANECVSGGSGTYVARFCVEGGHFLDYLQHAPTLDPSWETSASGGNQSFSLMQPTNFIGNLFVYSGEIHS